MDKTRTALVTGAAGFIGHHLVRFLQDKGYWVAGIDYKYPEFAAPTADWRDFGCDIREYTPLHRAVAGLKNAGLTIDEVYALAADMGGMGYIGTHGYDVLRNNAYINLNTCELARRFEIPRVLFTSSACVYPEEFQDDDLCAGLALAEDDAWQGKPDTFYGIEKLMAEAMYQSLAEETSTEVRIARFHNIYGPEGSWNDGREKAPAAVCRKIARAKLRGGKGPHPIEMWGDGRQTRSFCYITDCLEMIWRLMRSDCREPLNIGTDVSVAIVDLYELGAEIAEVPIALQPDMSKPQGVRHRNADLSEMRRVLDYEPQVSLEEGMRRTYEWIAGQIELEAARGSAAERLAGLTKGRPMS